MTSSIEILPSDAKKELARRNLLDFTRYTKEDYRVNWHHESYAEALDQFIRGEIKRLMVFMPPQHGKSELCSRRMPAKILGDRPDTRVALCAYNHSFASKFNRDVQRIIDSVEYRELYPGSTLSGRNGRSDAKGNWLRNADEFEIVGHKGSLISVGIGGGLTGNKVDVAIVDDPYKDAADANSEAIRRRLVEWWESVLETRLHNNGQICLTFTRWRHDDIAGHLLELQDAGITTDEWVVVKYEGLKESRNDDPRDKRKPGEALWPEAHSKSKLENAKARSPIYFEALYQQRPTPRTGNIIKDEYFFRYELHELPANVVWNCYIDTALSEEELKNNDPTGVLYYAVWKNKLYLTHFEKGRWGLPDAARKVEQNHARMQHGRRSKVWIENKANGRSLKQLLERETGINVLLENIKGKKLERLENELPTLEAKKVGVPIGETWVEPFLAQCLGFPLLAHDEEVDCLTGAIRTGLGTGSRPAVSFVTPKR